MSEKLKQYIVEQGLMPGDKLPTEAELMEMSGVSRSTVREAIKQLQSAGILDVKPGQGSILRQFDLREAIKEVFWGFHLADRESLFKDFFQARYTFDMSMIPLIVRNITDVHLKTLEEQLQIMENPSSEMEHRYADAFFHRTLVQATGNKPLTHMGWIILEFFNIKSNLIKEKIFDPTFSRWPEVLVEHRGIYESCKNRDMEKLAERMETHYRNMEKTYGIELVKPSVKDEFRMLINDNYF